MKNAKLVLFDIDNTITHGVDTIEYYNQYSPMLEKTLANALSISLKEAKRIADEYRAKHHGMGQIAFEELDIDTFAWYDAISEIKIKEYLKPKWDINSFFKNMKSKGITLGIITDGPIIQAKKILKACEVDRFLFDIFIAWERGKKMPKNGSSKVYSKIVKEFPFKKKEIFMVGDSLRADVLPALKVGINAVHISDQKYNDNCITVKTIRDLEGLI